jgi:carboxyl-terminal processing protease
MFSKKKLILSLLILGILFGFKQADEYFEISKNLEIFGAVYKTINNEYVDEVNPGDLMKKGIDAMLTSLDPYTNYFNESQAEDAMIRQRGEYGGVGCRSKRIGDFIYITEIFEGLPADKAGLRVGDKILEINGKAFANKNDEELGENLKGSPGTKASLLIDRQGSQIKIEITREDIKIKNVSFYGPINPNTGYIKLDHFMIGAASEIKEALIKMKAQGIKQVVLDLRDNGGGLLHEAVNIVNIFVAMDEQVVVSKGRSKDAYREYRTLDPPVDQNIPLIVLVNKNSASASEIVCGAIQDLDRGIVIGRNTFGKGLVQNVIPLAYRNQMKITIAKYYIPSGRCIQLLDYSNKGADGKAIAIADSLRKKFKTRNGRIVLDGGGVRPDIAVDVAKQNNIVTALDKSNLIFEFANRYRNNHPSIEAIGTFQVDDNLFNEFKSFLKGKTFTYKSATETSIDKLKASAAEDHFNEAIKLEIEQLEKSLLNAKNIEIESNKSEIKQMLKHEIASRYYYEKANILIGFYEDPDILKALETFANSLNYMQILNKK